MSRPVYTLDVEFDYDGPCASPQFGCAGMTSSKISTRLSDVREFFAWLSALAPVKAYRIVRTFPGSHYRPEVVEEG